MHFKANSLRGANYISGSSGISNFVDAYINIYKHKCNYMYLYVSICIYEHYMHGPSMPVPESTRLQQLLHVPWA